MMSETGLEDAQSRQISTSFAEHTIPMGGLPNTSFIRDIKKSSNTTLKLVKLSMLTIVAGARGFIYLEKIREKGGNCALAGCESA